MNPAMLTAAITPGQSFFVQVLGFVILVGVLVKLAIPALGKILGSRSQGIEETFRKIDQDTQETSKRLAEVKEKVSKLTQESQQRLDAALADAEKTRARMQADATLQAQAAFDKTKREIAIERDKAVLELRQEATALTLRAAEHLVQSTMSEPIHENLVEQFLKQLESVKKT